MMEDMEMRSISRWKKINPLLLVGKELVSKQRHQVEREGVQEALLVIVATRANTCSVTQERFWIFFSFAYSGMFPYYSSSRKFRAHTERRKKEGTVQYSTVLATRST
jgi:hypothetical protein